MTSNEYIENTGLHTITDDQEFMEAEYDAVRTYCRNCGYMLSDEDFEILRERGLEESYCNWKGAYLKDLETVRKNVQDILGEEYEVSLHTTNSVYPMLLNQERNKELLEQIAWRPFLDLAIAYVLRLLKNSASIKVTRKLLDSWGITEEELYEQAMKNWKKDEYQIQNLEQIYVSLTLDIEKESEQIPALDHLEEDGLYVLTNKDKYFGAAGILSAEYLKQITGGRSCFIIPNSIHETILVLGDGFGNVHDLNCIVREVNVSSVGAEEWLY